MKSCSILSFILLLSLLISLEIYAIHLSYENYGWWMPVYLFGLTLLNIIPILFFIFRKRLVANILSILLGLLIIPNQFILQNKYLQLKEEAANITNFVYQKKMETGNFPENIKNYKYRFPELVNQIQYSKDNNNEFIVLYSVGTTSTSHYFRHSRGNYWNYYDD